jgi:DNA-binding NtrC family response regulator
MSSQRAPTLLLVEPDTGWRTRLRTVARAFASVDTCNTFREARRRLASNSYAFLVTNIRLGPYNGLHLLSLNCETIQRLRAVAYTGRRDIGLGREAHRACAFYETRDCLPFTLPALLCRDLPLRDRRDPAQPDRRARKPSGGRRIADRQCMSNRRS